MQTIIFTISLPMHVTNSRICMYQGFGMTVYQALCQRGIGMVPMRYQPSNNGYRQTLFDT